MWKASVLSLTQSRCLLQKKGYSLCDHHHWGRYVCLFSPYILWFYFQDQVFRQLCDSKSWCLWFTCVSPPRLPDFRDKANYLSTTVHYILLATGIEIQNQYHEIFVETSRFKVWRWEYRVWGCHSHLTDVAPYQRGKHKLALNCFLDKTAWVGWTKTSSCSDWCPGTCISDMRI